MNEQHIFCFCMFALPKVIFLPKIEFQSETNRFHLITGHPSHVMCWGHVTTMKHATVWNIYCCVMRAWSRSSFGSFLKVALCCGSCVDPCWTVSELQYHSTQLKTIASYVMHLSLFLNSDDLLKCKMIHVELKVKVQYSHRRKTRSELQQCTWHLWEREEVKNIWFLIVINLYFILFYFFPFEHQWNSSSAASRVSDFHLYNNVFECCKFCTSS